MTRAVQDRREAADVEARDDRGREEDAEPGHDEREEQARDT